MRQKFLDGKSWDSPLILSNKIFRSEKFSEAQNGSPTKFFGTVSQNIFDGKWWHPPNSCSENFLIPENFLKQSRVPLWNFSELSDKSISTRNRDIPSLLLYKNCKISDVFRNTERFPYEDLRYCETKIFSTENRDTPPLLHVIPRYQTFFDTQKGPLRSFLVIRDKNFSTENRYTPLTLIHIIFLKHTFCETRKGSSTKPFGTARWRNFDGKSRYSVSHSPLSSLKFFDKRIFLKHRMVPLRSSSVLWDEMFFDGKSGSPL